MSFVNQSIWKGVATWFKYNPESKLCNIHFFGPLTWHISEEIIISHLSIPKIVVHEMCYIIIVNVNIIILLS